MQSYRLGAFDALVLTGYDVHDLGAAASAVGIGAEVTRNRLRLTFDNDQTVYVTDNTMRTL